MNAPMKNKTLILCWTLIHLTVCNGCGMLSGKETSYEPVPIRRFDKDLYQLILVDSPERQQVLAHTYPRMFRVLGLSLFNEQETQSDEFFDRLVNYYSEPNLNKLYRDALAGYETVERIENDLGRAFGYMREQFPEKPTPVVYMHVSGLFQNVLVDDSLLSISIDKYLGTDYLLYRDYFDAYQRRGMTPDYVVPDYLTAWLMSEYPFSGNDNVLLDRMIYEGKIKYVVHQAFSQVIPEVWMKYTSEEYQWCKENESRLWKQIIERKQLYTPDRVTTSKYFLERPSSFISDEAPSNLGTWIGWQIVTRYMERTNVSVAELMTHNDAQDILTKSKYKP